MYEDEQVPSVDAQAGVRINRRRAYRLKVYKSRMVRIVIIGLLAALLPSAFSAPSNFLELDGNIIKDGSGVYDWANSGPLNVTGTTVTTGTVISRSGSGGIFDGGTYQGTTTPPLPPHLTPAAASDPSIPNAIFIPDPLSTDNTTCSTKAADPTTFTGSNKNADPISSMTWGAGQVPAKSELSDVYAVSHVSQTVNEIFFGAERVVNNGDSHVDFEFLQSPISTNADSNGCAPAGGGTFSGHRTEGDLLVAVDFGNGGALGTVNIFRWQCGTAAGPDGVICDPSVSTTANYVLASTSAVSVQVNSGGPIECGGWACRDVNGNFTATLDTNEFLEGGIDLAAAGFATGCFSTFLPHTRTSTSFSSSLEDFAGPISFSNCKTPTVATTLSSGSQSGTHLTVSAGASVSDTAVLTKTAGTPAGSVTYTVFSNSACTPASAIATQTVTLNGDGSVPSTSNIAFPDAGTFYWQAAYSGDGATGGKNLPAVSPCTAEVLTVNAAHITLTKTADATPVDDGMPIGFTVTATNTGAGDATGVTVNDPLPAAGGVNWVIDPPNAACTITGAVGSQVLHCSFGTLASGASASVHILSSTDASTGTSHLVNVASVTTTNDGSASATATVDTRAAHITLAKTADADPVNDGMPIGFTVTATNTGAAAATAVTVNDPLPAAPGVSWVIDAANSTPGCTINGTAPSQTLVCNFGTLGSGASAHVHITSATDGTTGTQTLVNVASVTTTNDGSDTATATVHTLAAQIGITKTADASPVADGSPIGFTIQVGNSGAAPATTVTVNDPLPGAPGVSWSIDVPNSAPGCTINGSAPAQTLVCSLGTIASGASVSIHITSPTTGATGTRTLTNTATAATGNDGSGQSTATVSTLAAAVGVVKTADQAVVSAGDPIGFTITATNTGAAQATTVTVTDTLTTPAGVIWTATPSQGSCTIVAGLLTCTLGTLAANGGTATIHLTSPTNAASCTTIDNTAFITSGNDGSGSSQAASITIQCPDVGVTKTAVTATINAGDTAAFTIVVFNNGPGSAAGVTATDTLPPGLSWTITTQPAGTPCAITAGVLNCTFGTLAAGTSVTVTVAALTSAANCGSLVNTARVHATNEPNTDAAERNDVSSAIVTVNCASIGITKTADSTPVSAGDPIGFTLDVVNSGSGIAHGVLVTDTLETPAGISWSVAPSQGSCGLVNGAFLSCEIGDLAANGGSATIHLTSPTTKVSCGTLNNTAFVTTTNDGSGNSSASIDVLCPDVGVTKTAVTGTINAGDTAAFQIQITNAGPGDASGLALNDPLPGNLAWQIQFQSPVPACSIQGGSLTCAFGTFGPNVTFTVIVSAPTTKTDCGPLVNNVTVTATNQTTQPTSGATIQVNCANVNVLKTADQHLVSAGDPIGFTITATNTGAGAAHGVVVTDTLVSPAGVSWTATTSQGSCTFNSGTALLTCTIGDLAPGGTAVIHLTSRTAPGTCTTITNEAFISSSNDGSGNSTDSLEILCPDVTVTKTAVSATVNAGGTAAFNIVVANGGPGTAHGVTLTDVLPGGITWTVTSQPAGNPCTITGSLTQTLSCSFGDVASGASLTVVVSGTTAAANCGMLVNTVTVGALNQAGDPTSQAVITVVCPSNPPEIHVHKKADDNPESAGEQIGFTIEVSNSGGTTATDVVLTDHLPTAPGIHWTIDGSVPGCSISGNTLTCTRAALAAGGHFTVHVVSDTSYLAFCDTLHNTARVTSENGGSDESSADIHIKCAHITVTKKADDNPESRGEQIGFTIVVKNTGEDGLLNPRLSDDLPTGTGIHWSIANPVAGCSIADDTLTCAQPWLDPDGGSFTVHVISPTTYQTECTTLHNTAKVTSTNGGSDQDSAEIHIKCAALSVEKHADNKSVTEGNQIGFTITVKNTGDDGMLNPKLVDPLPDGDGISWTIANPVAGCSITGDTLTCTQSWLDPDGGSFTVHVVSDTGPSSCGTYDNHATASSTNTGDAQDSAELEVTGCPTVQGNSTVQTNGNPGSDVLGEQFNRQPSPSTIDQVVPAVTHALLPFTGFNAVATSLLALMLLATGSVLVLISRKRNPKGE
ncbi:MAG TPA: hypothetical protein VFW71_15330 [Actinomycetota bacterium]|nr:hypothetical protein [Actinomycetota bacterium]